MELSPRRQVLQELFNRDASRGISAPGALNQVLAQVVGEHSILMLEPRPHRARRHLHSPPFPGERLRAYGELIIGLSGSVLADLQPGEAFDARQRLQRISMGVILAAVFGLHEGALALVEMKLVLATLRRRFPLALCPESNRPIQPRRRGFTLGPGRPVRLR
ncbi:MAG: hypothetical protein ACKO7Z_04840 [Cyanobacteriota bacterium]